MPVSWEDSLDSDTTPDGIQSFQGGMFSNAKARQIAANQSALIQDAEIAVTGQLSTRFGTAQVGPNFSLVDVIRAVSYFNAPGFAYEVAFNTNNLYKNTGGSWALISAVGGTEIPSIVQGINKLYCAAGGDIVQYDGTTATTISSDTVTAAPRGVSIVKWHTNRLVCAGPVIKETAAGAIIPDAIYFSDILTPGTFSTNKNLTQIRVGAGDGQANVAVVPWTNFYLAVFKRGSVWTVLANPSLAINQFSIERVHDSVGCVAKKTAVQVGSDIFFLSDDGVRSLTQVAASDSQHELELPISYPVQDYFDRINPAAASQACAIYWRGKYIISVPLDTSTTNNAILVYDTIVKAWQGVWTNLSIYSMGIRLVSGVPHLMMGTDGTTSKVIEYLDFIHQSDWIDSTFTDYNSTPVQPRIKTRAFTFGDLHSPKHGYGGELEWNNSKGHLSVTPVLDEVNETAFTVDVSSGGFQVPFNVPFSIAQNGLAREPFDLMQYGEFREIQFDVIGQDAGRKELRQINMEAFVLPTTIGNS